MEQNSLRLKVVRLAQRSRRAIRLYTSVYNSASSTRPSSSSSLLNSSVTGFGVNVYGSSSMGVGFHDTIINDLADSSCESHTLGSASMTTLSTKGSSSRIFRNAGERFSEMQAAEWREVNMSLLRALTSALEEPRQRELPKRIIQVRNIFGDQWRNLTVLLQKNRAEALSAADRSDFINLAVLSEGLVGLKARCQASEAAYHELLEVCKGLNGNIDNGLLANISDPQSTSGGGSHSPHSASEQQPIFHVLSALGPDKKGSEAAIQRATNIRELVRERGEKLEGEAARVGVPTEESFHQLQSEKTSEDRDCEDNRDVSDKGKTKQATEDAHKVIMLKMAYS